MFLVKMEHLDIFLNLSSLTIKKRIGIDSSIIRHLTVKYKKLDTENEFFKKIDKNEEKK